MKNVMRGKSMNWIFCTSFKFWEKTKVENTKPLVTEKRAFQYRDETLLIALIIISDYQHSNAGNKYDQISIDNVSTHKKFLIETLREEKIRPVVIGVIGDKWGPVWMFRKTIAWRFFKKLRTIKFLIQQKNSTVFSSQYFSTSFIF